MGILLCSFFMVSVRGASTLEFVFENENLYDVIEPSYTKEYNVRAPEIYSGNYNATDSFESEVGFENNEIEWVSTNTDCDIIIIDELDGHSAVLNHTATGNSDMRTIFEAPILEGAIDMWIRLGETDESHFLYLRADGSSDLIRINWWDDGNLKYSSGGWKVIESYNANQWYHVRVEWNASDNWHLWINGVSKDRGSGYGFHGVESDVYHMIFGSATGPGMSFYLDGIGNSWDDDYSIGDNIVPLYEVNESIIEVNTFEFDYEAFNNLYDVGDDSPSGWSDVEIGGNDLVNIANDYGYFDREIEIAHSHIYDGEMGIEKEFNVDNGLINVSWCLTPYYMNDEGANFSTRILSSDDTAIIDIYLELDSVIKLYYNNGSDLVLLKSGLSEWTTIYDFNLFIDYSSDTWVLRFLENSTFIDYYFGSLYNIGKDGLGKVSFISHDVDGSFSQKFYIHNVGVYVNGSSLSTEFSYVYARPSPYKTWNLRENNLFTFFAKGNLSLRVVNMYGSYIPEVTNFLVLESMKEYFGLDYFLNVYDKDYYGVYSFYPMCLFLTLYGAIEFQNVSIDGVKLTEGVNDYYIDFSYDNIDINESYFYVDTSNRLRWNLIVNDNDTEYIQAKFNIQDVLSENRSLSFSSDINGDSAGAFRMNYVDTSLTSIDLPIHARTTTVILPQTKTIEEFTLIISDNDLDDNDVCTGYLSNIQLIYNPSIGITITTLTLLAIIVPLIVMFVPPLALYKKFGSGVILPMFLLMSLICVLANLIPIWLFFIIALSSIGFLVLKEKVEVGF